MAQLISDAAPVRRRGVGARAGGAGALFDRTCGSIRCLPPMPSRGAARRPIG